MKILTVGAESTKRTSIKVLGTDEEAKLCCALEKALETKAKPLGNNVSDDIQLFEHEGCDWLFVQAYYAGLAVLKTLKALGYPAHSTNDCVYKNNMPAFIRADIFNANLSKFILNAGNVAEDDADELRDVLLRINNVDISWPSESASSLDFVSYYLLLHRMVDKVIYDRANGVAMRVSNVTLHYGQTTYIMLYAEGLISFGNEVAAVDYTIKTPYFESTAVSSLRFSPINHIELKALEKKNKAYATRIIGDKASYIQYKGRGFTPGMFGSRIAHAVNHRVMADILGCHEIQSDYLDALLNLYNAELTTDSMSKVQPEPIKNDSDYAFVLPYGIFYNLTTSNWFIGHMENVDQITFRSDAFDMLVLDEASKKMIKAIALHRTDNIDFIDGKGGGSIFLLDGEPGTGKTLTAEAVSELLEKPIYKVGIGALGIDLEDLESNLTSILQLAERWDAVLLIDEADVFMEKRSSEGLHRNAMVAIFLRLIEYFSGIMFLTSNRGKNIDEAFISRITMAIHYKKADEEGKLQIWKNLLSSGGISLSDAELKRLCEFDVNGRVIKNSINTARSIAAYDKTTVSADHILSILHANKSFQETLCS